MKAERIRIGALVTPLPRRRPWKFARETATLDQLTGGRLIVGVGIGGDFWGEYSAFDEVADDKAHAAMLDEAIDVVRGLWSGKPFHYEGTHYTIHETQFLPTPAQSPRIPLWVAGVLPHKAPLRRTSRWDGVYPIHSDGRHIQPEEISEMLAYIRQHRSSEEPFDVVAAGYVGDMPTDAAEALLRSYAEVSVTWWQEGLLPGDTLDMVRAQIHRGPPSF